MNDEIKMTPIGVIESCYGEKFGTPRQSGIVSSSFGKVIFDESVDLQACRGLEEFSHIWLVFLFDQVKEEGVRYFVRPPRLGGNEKKGVFATRSPFRPNRIGLSLVKLEKVLPGVIDVSGLDLVNATPILDVKPYLPYVESIPEAKGGFAEEAPESLKVHFPQNFTLKLNDNEVELITESLALDPRPAFHQDPERIYGCLLAGYEVQWKVSGGMVEILNLQPSTL